MPLSASAARRLGGGRGASPGGFVSVGRLGCRGGPGSLGPRSGFLSPCPRRVVHSRHGLFFRSSLHRRRSASSALKYRHFRRFLAHPVKKGTGRSAALLLAPRACGLPPDRGPALDP